MNQQTANFCKYCNKYFHFKDLYDQHEITCEFMFRTRRQKDREDDYIEKLPTPQEQFKLIQYLTLKVNRLENDVARLKINAGTRKRKLVLDILNNPTNPKPNILFEERIKIITLNEEDLYAVFSEDNTNGIISALNRCLTYNNIPICSFQQKDNSIYIWTTKFNNSEINEPIWIMLDYKVFQKWVLELNHKILCIFVKWKANNMDFWLLMATFISTLIFGIEYGIVTGVGVSLIVLIYRTSRPYIIELGKVPNSNFYRNKERFSDVIVDDEVLVFRFDAQLFYANASYFRDNLDELAEAKGERLKLIVLDAESINRVDSTGVEMLKERIKYYQKRDILFYLAGVKGPVRDDLFRGKILDIIDINHFYMRVNGAVNFYKTGDRENQKKYANYIHQSD